GSATGTPYKRKSRGRRCGRPRSEPASQSEALGERVGLAWDGGVGQDAAGGLAGAPQRLDGAQALVVDADDGLVPPGRDRANCGDSGDLTGDVLAFVQASQHLGLGFAA